MQVISVRNAHEALPEAIYQMTRNGVKRASRNGPVFMHPAPVCTMYARPQERVLFWPLRDANPFFHLFEALWMLAGRNDVEYVGRFAKNMHSYSDDGVTLHGAYGARWRRLRGIDQLDLIAERLTLNENDRRQVVQMFDAEFDLLEQKGARDIPCNLTITFQVSVEGQLDMTVFNRSNDIVWGCYGANAVHFSVLQEYMAKKINKPIGRYWQISVNWHAYEATIMPLLSLQDEVRNPYTGNILPASPYEAGLVEPFPLVKTPARFDQEVKMFLDVGADALGYKEPFLRRVALPMLRAWEAWKYEEGTERFTKALGELEPMPEDNDWKLAARDWITRRQDKYICSIRAEDDGVNYEDD